MNSQQFKKINLKGKSASYGVGLPNKPGVYFFLKNRDILYIGKATSLRDRVKSYFGKDLIATRGPLLLDMVTLSNSIKWQETDSVLEALILETNLIKKYQPKYNTKEKDNKSFNYVCITKDLIPKVLVIRGRNLKKEDYNVVYGPFPNGGQLKEAMKIIRRIFPYIDEQSSKKNNKEFYKQLGLTPDVNYPKQDTYFSNGLVEPVATRGPEKNKCLAAVQEYKKNIKNLKLFFEGKKKNIIRNLKKEMLEFSKCKEFEKAGEIKKRLFALEHINDIALIKMGTPYENSFHQVLGSPQAQSDNSENNSRISSYRIEAYDIAHLAGSSMVGVMTVIENGQIAKSEYKKFIIKTQNKSNDTGALEEVLSRRLRHIEWGLPNLIVMDGGTAQINIAKKVIKKVVNQNIITQKNIFEKVLGSPRAQPDRFQKYFFSPQVVSVLKDDKHKAKAIMGDEEIIKKYKKEILLINSESHRFAISFHKKRRDKNFLNK